MERGSTAVGKQLVEQQTGPLQLRSLHTIQPHTYSIGANVQGPVRSSVACRACTSGATGACIIMRRVLAGRAVDVGGVLTEVVARWTVLTAAKPFNRTQWLWSSDAKVYSEGECNLSRNNDQSWQNGRAGNKKLTRPQMCPRCRSQRRNPTGWKTPKQLHISEANAQQSVA